MYDSSVCYKHKGSAEDVSWRENERDYGQEKEVEVKENSIKEQIGLVIALFGMVGALIGAVWMFDDYVASQMAGSFLLFTGLFTTSIGMKMYGIDKIDIGLPLPNSTNVSMRHRLVLILCLTIISYVYYVE